VTARYLTAVSALALLAALITVGATPAAEAGTASVSGRVTNSAGAGLSGVEVSIMRSGTDEWVATIGTDTSGHYAVSSLESGSYTVRFMDFNGYLVRWWGGDENQSSAVPLVVGEGGTVDASATLYRGGIVTGTITPPSRRKIEAWQQVDQQWTAIQETYSNSTTGAYSLNLSTTAPVKLRTSYDAQDPYANYWYGDAFSVDTATAVTVLGDATVTADFTPPASAKLAGEVTNAYGAPISGWVRAYVKDRGQLVALGNQSAINGTYVGKSGYSISVPAGREVTVRASSSQFTPTWLGQVPDGERDRAQSRTLSPTETRYGNDIALPGLYGFHGELTDRNGVGVEGATVTAFSGEVPVGEGITDRNGRYRLTGLGSDNDSYTVRFSVPGMATRWWRSAPTQDDAEKVWVSVGPWDVSYWVSETVTFDADHQLAPTSIPTVTGELSLGGRAEVTPATWNATFEERDLKWTCGSEVIGFGETAWLDSRVIDGCQLVVTETVTRPGFGSGRVTSASVQVPAFAASAAPRVTGTAVVGSTLHTSAPTFTVEPDYVTYQWLRNGAAISGANGATYRLTTADVGRRITVRATAYPVAGDMETKRASTSGATAVIRANSTMSVSAAAGRRKASLVVRLSTPGTSRPDGYVQFYRGARLLASYLVTSAQVRWVKTVKSPKGLQTFTVKYNGSTLATSTYRRVNLRIR
jgi:hypothetical protein